MPPDGYHVVIVGERGKGLALELTAWSRDLVLCTDGPAGLEAEDLARLARHGIAVRQERLARLEGADGGLARIVFASGEQLPRRALFFNTGQHQRSHLPARLDCSFTDSGDVATSDYEATSVPGVYVAGDASRRVQLVAVAAAEGALDAYTLAPRGEERVDGLAWRQGACSSEATFPCCGRWGRWSRYLRGWPSGPSTNQTLFTAWPLVSPGAVSGVK